MNALFGHAWHGVSRNLGRTLLYILGLALAVGLLADTLFFVDSSSRSMTRDALAPIQVDFIARATAPELTPAQLEGTLKNQPLVKQAVPVASADFASLLKVGGSSQAPAGKVFSLPESYYQSFAFLPISAGRFDPAGAMVGDATATQLGLKPGDTLELRFAAGPKPYRVRVSGIVAMGAAEPLFFNPTGGEGFGVVSDVVFLPPSLFERDLAPALEKLPVTTSSVGQTGTNLVLLPVERQVHLKVDRSGLNADPLKAQKQLDALRRSLERPFPGQVRVQDNLSQKLSNAKKDILAAKMLFTFLSLPGVLLAAYLARYAAELSGEAVRRELAWLRVRGAGGREVLLVTGFTALLVGILGTLAGLVLGFVALVGVLGMGALSGTLELLGSSALYATLAGLILTALAFFLPAWANLRREVAESRRTVPRTPVVPLWRRMGLDFLALISAGIVLYVTNSSGGFKPTGTEGTAVTLSFYLFLAPFLFWIGATLLVARLADLLLSRGASGVARVLRAVFGEFGELAARSLERRRGVAGAALTLTGLALGFGIALTLFLGTYAVQKRGDIQYVVGSDVRVTPAANAGLTPDFAQKLESIPGVSSATSLARDALALIGSEKKSVYGLDVPSFLKTAYLPDAMFENGSARATLEALQNTPNGVLVARDQADKYGINVGDKVLMRLYNPRTAQYVPLEGQAVGIFTYLSTSSSDSDFVLNRAFMTRTVGTNGADLFLVKTATPLGVTALIQQQFGANLTLKLENTLTATKVDSSSLTSLNLGGLGTLERLYTALIVASGLGIFLLSMLDSRRKEFGVLRAMGGDEGQLRRMVGAEVLSLSSLSLLAGIGTGAGVAALFVTLLRVIFLIPPAGVLWPLGDLLTLLGLAALGVLGGVWLANSKLSSLKVAEVLREG